MCLSSMNARVFFVLAAVDKHPAHVCTLDDVGIAARAINDGPDCCSWVMMCNVDGIRLLLAMTGVVLVHVHPSGADFVSVSLKIGITAARSGEGKVS